MMIKQKKFKIGRLTVFYFDWFELCKYLSVLAGMIIGVATFGLYELLVNDKMTGLFLAVSSLVLLFVIGSIINIIREAHDDKIKISVDRK